MRRDQYRIFSEGRIGTLRLPNRLVRSAIWDPCILGRRQMTEEVLDLYQELAQGGAGLIISGGLPVTPNGMFSDSLHPTVSYEDVRVEGLTKMAQVVRAAGTGCKIVAQLENGNLDRGPSAIASPFRKAVVKPLSISEIETVIGCFVEAINRMREEGFDGVQVHAAHGSLLSRFLSPYTNRREDMYGGSIENRSRIVRDIVSRAREKVADYPILIKVNGTDFLEGGTDLDTFPVLARAIAAAGVDAVEVSGGMWECLARPEEDLPFHPVPSPESHTRIKNPSRQSYFLKYAESLDLTVPVILVGGNRDVERLEAIVSSEKVNFIALGRPLICEPDLPNRWREGRGSSTADCISCNSCLYEMLIHPGRPEPGPVKCLLKRDRQRVRQAQKWLSTWVSSNTVARAMS